MSVMRVTGKGGHNVLCPQCQRKFKAADLRKRWDGVWVCSEDWEPRHPLDFYTVIKDTVKLPFVYPDTDGPDVGPAINPITSTAARPR